MPEIIKHSKEKWVMTLIKAYSDSECFQLYVIPKISTL